MKTNWPAFRFGCLILASMAVAALPSPAQTQEPTGATATASVISSVAITQASQRAAVRVEGEGRLEARAARMSNPDRLVLDFSGTRLAVQKTVIPGLSAPVRGVRLGQYRPDVARIVVDLTSAAPYQIAREGASVVIYFDAQLATPVAAAQTRTTSNIHETKAEEKVAHPQFRDVKATPRTTAAPTAKAVQL